MSDLGRVIRRIRERNRMTTTEFAKLLGVDQSTISRYESGHRQPGLIILGKLLQLAEGTEQNPILQELGPFLPSKNLSAPEAVAWLVKHADPGWLDVASLSRPRLAEFISIAAKIGERGKEIDPALVQILRLWLESDTADLAVCEAFEDAARFLRVALLSRSKPSAD